MVYTREYTPYKVVPRGLSVAIEQITVVHFTTRLRRSLVHGLLIYLFGFDIVTCKLVNHCSANIHEVVFCQINSIFLLYFGCFLAIGRFPGYQQLLVFLRLLLQPSPKRVGLQYYISKTNHCKQTNDSHITQTIYNLKKKTARV